LDSDQATFAIDVAPAQSAELAEPQTSAERDVEEVDVNVIRFGSEWIVRSELEQCLSYRIRVRDGKFFADEVLGRRQVGARCGVDDDQSLSYSIREHAA